MSLCAESFKCSHICSCSASYCVFYCYLIIRQMGDQETLKKPRLLHPQFQNASHLSGARKGAVPPAPGQVRKETHSRYMTIFVLFSPFWNTQRQRHVRLIIESLLGSFGAARLDGLHLSLFLDWQLLKACLANALTETQSHAKTLTLYQGFTLGPPAHLTT